MLSFLRINLLIGISMPYWSLLLVWGRNVYITERLTQVFQVPVLYCVAQQRKTVVILLQYHGNYTVIIAWSFGHPDVFKIWNWMCNLLFTKHSCFAIIVVFNDIPDLIIYVNQVRVFRTIFSVLHSQSGACIRHVISVKTKVYIGICDWQNWYKVFVRKNNGPPALW